MLRAVHVALKSNACVTVLPQTQGLSGILKGTACRDCDDAGSDDVLSRVAPGMVLLC